MRILVTRPAEDAERLAAAIRASGHEPVIHPLLKITFPHAEPLPVENIQAVIATSRNALRGAQQNSAFAELIRLPVFCVGKATAALAQRLGFAEVKAGPGRGEELAALITATLTPSGGRLLHLAGNHKAFDMRAALEPRGFTVLESIVYRSELMPRLQPDVEAGLREHQINAVILMSPRTADYFTALMCEHGLVDCARGLIYYCLSEEIAARLAPIGPERVKIPRTPDLAALMALLGPTDAA